MIVVGLALIVIGLAIAAVLVTGGGQEVSMNVAGVSVDTTTGWFFVAGVAATVLALVGMWCVRFGTRRSLRLRRKNRALRREAEQNQATTRPIRKGEDGDADTYFDSTPRE